MICMAVEISTPRPILAPSILRNFGKKSVAYNASAICRVLFNRKFRNQ